MTFLPVIVVDYNKQFLRYEPLTREGVREKSAVLLFWSDRRQNKKVQNSTCGSRHLLIIPWMRAIHRRGEPGDLITEYENRALVSSNRTQCECWSFYIGMERKLNFFCKKSMLSIHVARVFSFKIISDCHKFKIVI